MLYVWAQPVQITVGNESEEASMHPEIAKPEWDQISAYFAWQSFCLSALQNSDQISLSLLGLYSDLACEITIVSFLNCNTSVMVKIQNIFGFNFYE